MKLRYWPAVVPDVLAGTCVELAWSAADIEATGEPALAGEHPADALALAAMLVDATPQQVVRVEQLAIAIARMHCEIPAQGHGRWPAWHAALLARGHSPWRVLADAADLLASPLDVDMGLVAGRWDIAAERDAAE